MELVEELIATPEGRKVFEREKLLFEVTELISTAMEEKKMNKTELAKLLKVNKSYITQLLSGHENMTLAKVSDVLFELGKVLKIEMTSQCVIEEETSHLEFSSQWLTNRKLEWPKQPPIVSNENTKYALKMAG